VPKSDEWLERRSKRPSQADSAEFELKIWGYRPSDPGGGLGGPQPITDKDQEAGQSQRNCQPIEKEETA
jgi:hypothetical protein